MEDVASGGELSSSSPPTLELERRSSDSLSDSDSGDDDKDLEDPGDIRLALLPQSSRPNHHSIASSSPIGTEEESTASLWRGILKEAVPTLFASVIGMLIVGELMERISTWRALKQQDDLFIMIPMLLNMKGNLELNLSARLSTAANTGILDDVTARKTLILGNLSLLQVQAIVMSALAAIFSFGIGEVFPAPTPENAIPLKGNSTLTPRSVMRITVIPNHQLLSRGMTRPATQRTKHGIDG